MLTQFFRSIYQAYPREESVQLQHSLRWTREVGWHKTSYLDWNTDHPFRANFEVSLEVPKAKGAHRRCDSLSETKVRILKEAERKLLVLTDWYQSSSSVEPLLHTVRKVDYRKRFVYLHLRAKRMRKDTRMCKEVACTALRLPRSIRDQLSFKSWNEVVAYLSPPDCNVMLAFRERRSWPWLLEEDWEVWRSVGAHQVYISDARTPPYACYDPICVGPVKWCVYFSKQWSKKQSKFYSQNECVIINFRIVRERE